MIGKLIRPFYGRRYRMVIDDKQNDGRITCGRTPKFFDKIIKILENYFLPPPAFYYFHTTLRSSAWRCHFCTSFYFLLRSLQLKKLQAISTVPSPALVACLRIDRSGMVDGSVDWQSSFHIFSTPPKHVRQTMRLSESDRIAIPSLRYILSDHSSAHHTMRFILRGNLSENGERWKDDSEISARQRSAQTISATENNRQKFSAGGGIIFHLLVPTLPNQHDRLLLQPVRDSLSDRVFRGRVIAHFQWNESADLRIFYARISNFVHE